MTKTQQKLLELLPNALERMSSLSTAGRWVAYSAIKIIFVQITFP